MLTLVHNVSVWIGGHVLYREFTNLGAAKNRDAARQEGLIPLWLAILQSGAPHHQKHAGNCVQSLAYNGEFPLVLSLFNYITDTNKDELREVGGIDKILKALSTTRTTVVEVAMNCVNTLILLSVNRMSLSVEVLLMF